jgi:hypothetical protein
MAPGVPRGEDGRMCDGSRLMVGSVHVSVAPDGLPPFPVEAAVREEDTYLVLSSPAAPSLRAAGLDPEELVAELRGFRPARPGTVVVRRGDVLELLAVVHDLSAEPTWRREWVRSALQAALSEAELRELTALSVPLLGARHGSMSAGEFCALLVSSMRDLQPRYIRYLWVRTSGSEGRGPREVASALRRLSQRGMLGG